jgi:hypothetical protein
VVQKEEEIPMMGPGANRFAQPFKKDDDDIPIMGPAANKF